MGTVNRRELLLGRATWWVAALGTSCRSAQKPEGMTMKQIREWGTEDTRSGRYDRYLPY